MRTSIKITGYLVGPIWWPAGLECYKHFTYDLTREDERFCGRDGTHEPGTLRDHVLSLMMEHGGDFQHCEIANAALCAAVYRPNRSRSRIFDLELFPSIADCVKTDWHGPDCEEPC